MIHENMLWNQHITYVSSRVSRATGLLAKLKHYLPRDVLLIIYNSLCLSHISYAITVWGSAPSSNLKRLVTLHKKGIRHACNSKYNSHTDPLYIKTKTLKLTDLFKLNCVKLMFKKTQSQLHAYHSEQIPTKAACLNIETRQKHDVVIHHLKTNTSKMNSINYKIGSAWNELPFEIKNSNFKTVSTFSKNVKAYYISTYTDKCEIRNCYVCNRR